MKSGERPQKRKRFIFNINTLMVLSPLFWKGDSAFSLSTEPSRLCSQPCLGHSKSKDPSPPDNDQCSRDFWEMNCSGTKLEGTQQEVQSSPGDWTLKHPNEDKTLRSILCMTLLKQIAKPQRKSWEYFLRYSKRMSTIDFFVCQTNKLSLLLKWIYVGLL